MRAVPVGLALAWLTASCTAGADPKCLGRGDTEAALGAHLAAEANNGFTGAVVLNERGRALSWASPGFRPDRTRFWIASITKALTATAAVRLAERGAIRLDTRVADVFPSTSGPLRVRTLAQLLAHRAGLEHHYAADGIADRMLAVAAVNAHGVETDGFKYSNDGYSLAAAMLEQMTGTPIEQILSEEVFEPAGMLSSGVWGQRIDPASFAPFSTAAGGKMVRDGVPVRNYGQLGPSGVYSTPSDLLAFLTALRKGRLVSDKGRDSLWRPGWGPAADGKPRSGTSYGLGWSLTVDHGRVIEAWHGGNEDWLRHNGQIRSSLTRPLDIVVLSNAKDTGDVSWSKRVIEGIEDCLRSSRWSA